MTGPVSVVAGLRVWAHGWLSSEAAAELLIRACGGVLVDPACPWINRTSGGWEVVTDQLARHALLLPPVERRVLAIAQGLLTGCGLWNVAELLHGLDRSTLELVLAALSHAGGGHEPVDVTTVNDQVTIVARPDADLMPWPALRTWAVA